MLYLPLLNMGKYYETLINNSLL